MAANSCKREHKPSDGQIQASTTYTECTEGGRPERMEDTCIHVCTERTEHVGSSRFCGDSEKPSVSGLELPSFGRTPPSPLFYFACVLFCFL